MATPKIFIASSGRTLDLGKQLRDQLDPNYCIADLWTEVSTNHIGESILTMLKKATKEYDFAVVILAKDDVMITDTGDVLKARDNCVFEAGLFMGVIGEDRCFLVSSVPQSDLPSDLSGIIYLPFKEPPNLTDSEACRRAIVSAATRIETRVRAAGPVRNRPLSRERLLDREKRTHEGGELLRDQVVVASVQPLDVGYDAASQLRQNIDVGNIRYIYFFQGNQDGAEKTCQLLQLVLVVKFLKSWTEADDWRGVLEKVKNNSTEIVKDLEGICEEERIKIYFLASPPALQYCIHNAASDKSAIMYLKRGEEFIEWESGRGAYEFWQEVRQARGALDPVPSKALFYGTPGFNIKEGTFFRTLRRLVEMYFPEIGGDVMRLCLEGASGD